MTELKLEPFGTMPGGDRIDLYTLTNERGTRVAITSYGARLVKFERLVHGAPLDIVLGYETGEDYVADTASMVPLSDATRIALRAGASRSQGAPISSN